jgi:hypothetical protein
MRNVYLRHPLDLDLGEESLDLFAEEVQESQEHPLPSNSLSSLGCECGLSTFFCYGCGLALAEQPRAADADPANMDAALAWAREKMDSTDENDRQVAEVLRTAFSFRRSS